MSSVEMNDHILSPVDSFILEYRNKISEDQKQLSEKSRRKNGISGSSREQRNVQVEPLPNILVTDCSNKENMAKLCQDLVHHVKDSNNVQKNLTSFVSNGRKTPTSIASNVRKTPTAIASNERKAPTSIAGNERAGFMKNRSVDRILQDKNRITPTRDEEKERFIDWLISSPGITSPRDESITPKSRRMQTPEMVLPINQRQADIEKLQQLFSESPSYVPNVNSVNQFCESYIRADSPCALSQKINTSSDENTQNANDLFDDYVNTFESGNASQVSQPMSITTNTFAHDQSCKKIIKIGEYSPLNPHFQPQPSVLDFSSPKYNEQGRRATCPTSHQDCPRMKRDLETQMPLRKKSKAVQISNPCIDDEIEVIGTRVGSLPDIDNKDCYRRYLASRTLALPRGKYYDINPEVRYPHTRSQHHVETCGGGDPMAAVKLKQEIYKTELDKQIEEKRRQEEERRRRETEEDEKAQRAYLEQQERLRREFELEEENKLHNAMQRQMREQLLKEKIRELQIEQEEEKARRRQEKEASIKRQAKGYGARDPYSRDPHAGNPSSIMLPNPFGSPRLDPISKVPSDVPLTYSGTQGPYLAPPPSHTRHRGASPQRDVSPSRSLAEDSHCRYNAPRSRDVSPLRPPIERFRDISPVRPLRETLPGSPSLGQKETIINNAPQELSMPLRRGKHNRVSFIEDTSPPRTRSTSPVLPAVRTHHRMKDLATTATAPCPPCAESGDTVLKNATNRNVLTQLGQFRRQLYLENLRMNERLRQYESGDN